MTILRDTIVIPDDQVPVTRFRFSSMTRTHSADSPTKKELFLKGPIPLDWLSTAAKLNGKALNVALAIQWLAGMNNGSPCKLTARALLFFNVSDDACNDGIRRLENAGLIDVARSPGQRPLIKINSTKLQQSTNTPRQSEFNMSQVSCRG